MLPSLEPSPKSVTQLLIEWRRGNTDALDLLIPMVYRELRRLADYYLRDERLAATLQPTVLVHEAYLRLVAQSLPEWQDRAHFFGVAARLMRQILVDHSRRRGSAKRGGPAPVVSIDEMVSFSPARGRDVEELDDALTALAEIDERKAKIVELRYFGGFGLEETGQTLGISAATVSREQRLAEAWLHREIVGAPESRPQP
jgi:RNA polymerase sigma factor (TIGR02999 family)